MQTATQSLNVIARIAAAILGGYIFTWGFVVSAISGLVAIGVAYDQARVGMMLLAFLVFLAAFLWSFAAKNLALVFTVLFGGGAAMTAMAWWVQKAMV